jgi:hypothetical protein
VTAASWNEPEHNPNMSTATTAPKEKDESTNSVEEDLEQLDDVLTHIENVRDNAIRVAKHLMEEDEGLFARQLVVRALQHDLDKFFGNAWTYMRKGAKPSQKLTQAVEGHSALHGHHPQHHDSIHSMSDLDIAEMACDWAARSKEQGTSIWEWIEGPAMERFGFKKSDPVYSKIAKYTKMIFDPQFKKVKK